MRFKEQKSWTPSSARPSLNKTKISGIKSEILIKYKRIKWTPRREGFALSFQGDKTKIFGYIKYNRIKWTPSRKALHLLPGG